MRNYVSEIVFIDDLHYFVDLVFKVLTIQGQKTKKKARGKKQFQAYFMTKMSILVFVSVNSSPPSWFNEN